MKPVKHLCESVLFIAGRPLSAKKLAALTGASLGDVHAALNLLMQEYGGPDRGVQLTRLGDAYQFTTSPASADLVQRFLEEEDKKELTRPSLEALTIIAYRGPVTKSELELIRGVNCSLILRNLLIRGLIEEVEDAQAMTTRYQITFDFLHYLGIREPRELPNYDALNANDHLLQLLRTQQEAVSEEPAESSAASGGTPEPEHNTAAPPRG